MRSKGVGVYFVTQNPTTSPDTILQPAFQPRAEDAATRLYAPRDQKAVKVAAETFRSQSEFFDRKRRSPSWHWRGRWSACPRMVACLHRAERTLIRPPSRASDRSRPDERKAVIAGSPFGIVCEQTIDRQSAS